MSFLLFWFFLPVFTLAASAPNCLTVTKAPITAIVMSTQPSAMFPSVDTGRLSDCIRRVPMDVSTSCSMTPDVTRKSYSPPVKPPSTAIPPRWVKNDDERLLSNMTTTRGSGSMGRSHWFQPSDTALPASFEDALLVAVVHCVQSSLPCRLVIASTYSCALLTLPGGRDSSTRANMCQFPSKSRLERELDPSAAKAVTFQTSSCAFVIGDAAPVGLLLKPSINDNVPGPWALTCNA